MPLEVFDRKNVSISAKNPLLPPTDVVGPHGASSKEKAILAIHPHSSGRGILAFSRDSVDSIQYFQAFVLLNSFARTGKSVIRIASLHSRRISFIGG